MTKLKVSPSLALPLDFVTSTQAILAKKGKGKTYKASVQAEELLAAAQQIVAIDPTGAWWGLRSSADGKHAGYPVTIFGGEHADVPLETTAGEVIAEAIASEHFSAIIDLSLFRKGEALRFMASFMETLYRKNRAALHLFIDEADVVAPQKTFSPEQARALGATDDLVRRGRIRGIGCTLITQRPQVLNKDVLSQIDMLTALGMNHPKDIGAIKDWVAVHGDEAQAKQMIADLPALPVGDAWVWAPAAGIFKRVTFRDRHTFDSGRTPKAGEKLHTPKVLAPIDLARLGQTIAATVEEQKANDPKALRQRVAELEKQIATKAHQVKHTVERVEVPVILDKQIDRIERTMDKVELLRSRTEKLTGEIGDAVQVLDAALSELNTSLELQAQTKLRPPAPVNGRAVVHRDVKPANVSQPARRDVGPGDVELGGGERKILTALAQYSAGRTKQQVAILTGYAHNGGGFKNYVSALRTKGYLEGTDTLAITEAGLNALGAYTPLPTGRALLEHWLGQLGKAEREILKVLHEEWPNTRPKEYVATKAGYGADGGGFKNALSRLRTLDLIEGKAKLKASDQLQDGAS